VVDLDLGSEHLRSARLRRTVFDGTERFADLGPWRTSSSITLPPRAIVTVVIDE